MDRKILKKIERRNKKKPDTIYKIASAVIGVIAGGMIFLIGLLIGLMIH